MSYDYYPRSSKPSHTGDDSYNGSFEPGRTVLPPLAVAFPTSDSPGSSSHVTPTYLPLNSTTPTNTVSGSHSIPHLPYQHPTYVQKQQYRAYLTINVHSITVLNTNAKTRLPSSKLHTARLVTLQIRSSCLRVTTRGTRAVRPTTTEILLPLIHQTLGDTRL